MVPDSNLPTAMATLDVTAYDLPSLPGEIVSAVIKCLSSSPNIDDQVFALDTLPTSIKAD